MTQTPNDNIGTENIYVPDPRKNPVTYSVFLTSSVLVALVAAGVVIPAALIAAIPAVVAAVVKGVAAAVAVRKSNKSS